MEVCENIIETRTREASLVFFRRQPDAVSVWQSDRLLVHRGRDREHVPSARKRTRAVACAGVVNSGVWILRKGQDDVSRRLDDGSIAFVRVLRDLRTLFKSPNRPRVRGPAEVESRDSARDAKLSRGRVICARIERRGRVREK